AGVDDRVHRIQPEPVEVILLEPVERVVQEEIAHGAPAGRLEVDRGTPGGRMPVGEELRRVEVEEVALWPEVVVDDVEHHRDAVRMRRAYQRLEILGGAVRRGRRIRQYTVISPASRARKFGHRHDLDGRHAEPPQMLEL